MHGRGGEVRAWQEGWGRAWQRDVRGSPPRQILRHTVNERAVRILLECILVFDICVCI